MGKKFDTETVSTVFGMIKLAEEEEKGDQRPFNNRIWDYSASILTPPGIGNAIIGAVRNADDATEYDPIGGGARGFGGGLVGGVAGGLGGLAGGKLIERMTGTYNPDANFSLRHLLSLVGTTVGAAEGGRWALSPTDTIPFTDADVREWRSDEYLERKRKEPGDKTGEEGSG